MKYITLCILIMLAGCTTAGPYVTSISTDGNCTLFIEKSSTEYSMITGTLANKAGNQTTIKVCDK